MRSISGSLFLGNSHMGVGVMGPAATEVDAGSDARRREALRVGAPVRSLGGRGFLQRLRKAKLRQEGPGRADTGVHK